MSVEMDPIQLGKLMAQIEHLQQSLEAHKQSSIRGHEELKLMIREQNAVINDQKRQIDHLKQIADRGYGALVIVLMLGTLLGSIISWAISLWKHA